MSYDNALRAAEAAAEKVADRYQVAAFTQVLQAELLGNGSSRATPLRVGAAAATRHVDGAPLGRIAAGLGLPPDDLAYIYDIEGDVIRLAFPPSKLDRTRSGATVQIFFLVTAARQLAFDANETDMETIRAVCSDNGKYDASNFASTLNEQAGLAVLSGTRRARTYRLTRAGIERASNVVAELVQKIKAESAT